MNFLLRPWLKPKLEVTGLDELVGTIEVIAIIVIITIIWFIIDQRKLK